MPRKISSSGTAQRGQRGIPGPPGPAGPRGTTGTTGATGARGVRGETGARGTSVSTGSASPHLLAQLNEIERAIEDIYSELGTSLKRMAQMQQQLDDVRARVQALKTTGTS